MKKERDATVWKRGPVIPSPGKTKITIRIDDDILEWFRKQIEKAHRGGYQTAINEALRTYMESKEGHGEAMVRKVVREELAKYTVKKNRAR